MDRQLRTSARIPVLWARPPGPVEDCLPGWGLLPPWNRAGSRVRAWGDWNRGLGAGERPALPPTWSELSGEVHALDCKPLPPVCCDLRPRRGSLGPPAYRSLDAVTVTLGLVRLPSLPWQPTSHSCWFGVCGSLHGPSGSFRRVLLCELRVTGSRDPAACPRRHGRDPSASSRSGRPPSANTSEPEPANLRGSQF